MTLVESKELLGVLREARAMARRSPLSATEKVLAYIGEHPGKLTSVLDAWRDEADNQFKQVLLFALGRTGDVVIRLALLRETPRTAELLVSLNAALQSSDSKPVIRVYESSDLRLAPIKELPQKEASRIAEVLAELAGGLSERAQRVAVVSLLLYCTQCDSAQSYLRQTIYAHPDEFLDALSGVDWTEMSNRARKQTQSVLVNYVINEADYREKAFDALLAGDLDLVNERERLQVAEKILVASTSPRPLAQVFKAIGASNLKYTRRLLQTVLTYSREWESASLEDLGNVFSGLRKIHSAGTASERKMVMEIQHAVILGVKANVRLYEWARSLAVPEH